jgi:hypothetical protein
VAALQDGGDDAVPQVLAAHLGKQQQTSATYISFQFKVSALVSVQYRKKMFNL